MNQGLGPEWKAQRLVIEQTGLLDWYFGLKRLLREGVRPDAIVVMLNTRQVLFRFVLGETFAHFLMDAPDLPEVSQRANLHPTDATGYLVGRYSEFYGSRGTLRKVLLGKLIPGMASLAALIVPAGSQPLDPHKVELDTGEKLSLLKRMSEEWKLPILLAIPPTGEKLNYNENCLAGARAAGVTVIMPVPNGELGQQYFRDGFHLNQAGVDAYTPRLAVALKDALAAH